MSHFGWKTLWACCSVLGLSLGASTAVQGNDIPLYSWEDDNFEGWTVTNFTSRTTQLAIGDFGITDGLQSLEIVQIGGGFNWAAQIGDLPQESPQRAAMLAAAANPKLYEFRFDVGMDTSRIPQERVGYLGISLFVNSNVENGFHAEHNVVINNAKTSGIFSAKVQVSKLAPISTEPTSFLQLGFAINGDWDDPNTDSDDELASVFIDNLRLFDRTSLVDLDANSQVNFADWGIFVANHKTDLSQYTAEQRAARGDVDGDGDNDFNDFQQFEEIYDLVNGPGALAQAVPEPLSGGLALACCAGMWQLARRRRRAAVPIVAAMLLASCLSSSSSAQLLHSWGNGLEGWTNTGFESHPVTLANSTIGATQGTQSLALTQGGPNFSWNARVSYAPGSPQYQIFRDAIAAGVENFVLEMDVTYDPSSISSASYLQTFLVLNVDGNWSQRDNLAPLGAPQADPVRISEPLNSWPSIANATAPNEIQVVIGQNGDWPGSATFHYDNLRIRQVVFPNQLTLEVGASGARILNSSGNPIAFDYYEITSAAGSLNPAGWNSLDAQNINATDGSDVGTVAGDSPGEGWDRAPGSTNDLTELFLTGGSTLDHNASFSLGNILTSRDQELKFRFRTQGGDHLVTGQVKFALQCDLNGDGGVDAADAGIMFGDWGPNASSAADKNADGFVDAADAGLMFEEWTGDPATPEASSATAEYNPATGELKISSDGAVNIFVQSASQALTPISPAPTVPVGLLTNNTSRVGITNLGPIHLQGFSFGNIGKGLAMSDLKLVYTKGLGQKAIEIAAGTANFAYVPEPTSGALLVCGLAGLALRRRNG